MQTVQTRTIRVLYLEDNPGDARLFGEIFRTFGRGEFEVTLAMTLPGALRVLSEQRVDLLLLDLGLPGSLDLSSLFVVLLNNPKVPIVVLTGLQDEEKALEALRWGAQDYVIKDEVTNGEALVRIARYAIERHRHLIRNH